MNPYSGATYALGGDLVGEKYAFTPTALTERAMRLDRELTDDEQAACADPGPLVMVSEEVAQKVKLGDRELSRRKKRRQQSRDSRRRNR